MATHPYVDSHKAELLFRHKVLRLLRNCGLITPERIDLLLSWRNSGFGVHNRTTVYPQDSEGLHKLACYLMRPLGEPLPPSLPLGLPALALRAEGFSRGRR